MNAARVNTLRITARSARGLSRLMARLGLLYGAADLRETSDGRVFFLEINPAGQWLFIEERTHQPITAAVAQLLATSVNAAK